jgi:hypothetical protein
MDMGTAETGHSAPRERKMRMLRMFPMSGLLYVCFNGDISRFSTFSSFSSFSQGGVVRILDRPRTVDFAAFFDILIVVIDLD